MVEHPLESGAQDARPPVRGHFPVAAVGHTKVAYRCHEMRDIFEDDAAKINSTVSLEGPRGARRTYAGKGVQREPTTPKCLGDAWTLFFHTESGVELRFVTRPDAPDRSLRQ